MPDLLVSIPEIWTGTPHEKVCQCLFEYLVKTEVDNLRLLSYMAIARICNDSTIDEVLLDSTAYFCGSKVKILQARFYLIDDDDDEYELPRGEFYTAQNSGCLIHPKTGEEVSDFEEKVHVYFTPTQEFFERYK